MKKNKSKGATVHQRNARPQRPANVRGVKVTQNTNVLHDPRLHSAPTIPPNQSDRDALNEAVAMAQLDPRWFCVNVLRANPDPWQMELLEAVADTWRKKCGLPTKINHEGKTKLSVRAMHGPGKTHGASLVMHWFQFCFAGRIVATAPKQAQLLTRLWPEFYKVLRKAIAEYRRLIDYKTSRITWGGDPMIYAIAETANQPENLAGHHASFMLFLVDEASGVEEEMFPVIEGAASTGELVIILLVGNPTRLTGTFADSHLKPAVSQSYWRYHVTLEKAPRVSRTWVQEQVAKYGPNSPVVKVRCYGEFAELDADQLIPLEWVVAARDRECNPTPHRGRLRVAVDVADGGTDQTVITIARMWDDHTHLVRMYRYNFAPSVAPIDSAREALRLAIEWGADWSQGDDIVVDAMGVGAGTAGWLIQQGIPCISYRGGEVSDDTGLYRNRRSQSYLVLRNGLRDNWISIADDFADGQDWEDFIAQLCSIRRRPGVERMEEIETKADLLRRIAKSPDCADSVAMVFSTQRPVFGTTQMEVLREAPVLVGGHSEAFSLDW